MLKTVHIQGFKTALHLELELGQVNVLIGANGSGKSNVLEALGLLACAASGRVDYDALRARGVRLGEPTLYRSALRAQKRLIDQITLEARSDGASYRVNLGHQTYRHTIRWSHIGEELTQGGQVLGARTKAGDLIVGSNGQRSNAGPRPIQRDEGLAPIVKYHHPDGALAELLDLLGEYAIYSPCTPMLRERVADPDPKPLLGLSGGGLAECAFGLRDDLALWERVQDEAFSLIEWATEARFNASSDWFARRGQAPPSHYVLSLRDRYMIEELGWISAREANEGALYILFLFLLLLHPDAPRVCSIDNVDHSLNPKLVGALIDRIQHVLLKEPGRPQVILTTQNPAVLDALDLKDDRVRLFLVTRDRDGVTSVRRFLYDEAIERAEEKWMPLSYLWTSGAIGGMPLL